MGLSFHCPECGAEVVVLYLSPGEEALCRFCGEHVPIPEDATETDKTPSLPPWTSEEMSRESAAPGAPEPTSGQFRMTAGGVISKSIGIIFNHFLTIEGLILLVYAPWFANLFYLMSRGGFADETSPALANLVHQLLPNLLGPLATAVVAYAVVKTLKGHRPSFGDCLSVGLSRLPAVFGVAIVTGIIIMCGYLLFIIPGVILSLMFFVAVPAAVVERLGVIGALERSSWLTRDRRMSILGVVLLSFAIIFVPMLAIPIIATTAGGVSDNVSVGILSVLSVLLGALFQSVVAAVTYHDLRVDKEGIDTDSILAVFE